MTTAEPRISAEVRDEVLERDETCVIEQWLEGLRDQDGIPEDFPMIDESSPLQMKMDYHHGIGKKKADPTLDQAWNIHLMRHHYHTGVLHGHYKYGSILKNMLKQVSENRKPENLEKQRQELKNQRIREKELGHKNRIGAPKKKKKLEKIWGATKPFAKRKKSEGKFGSQVALGGKTARKARHRKMSNAIDVSAYKPK